jgi:hypothetical protein
MLNNIHIGVFSGNGNPFVEQAVQFAVAAAKAAFVDNHDKEDILHKLLLQGAIGFCLVLSVSLCIYSFF